MTYFLAISCVVCGWAVLRILGSERSALMTDMEFRLRRAAKIASLIGPKNAPADVQSAPAAKAPAAANPKH
jgi:hypothetical protein